MKSNSDKRAGKPGTWTLSLIVRIQPPVFPALFVLTLIAIVCASNQLPLQAGVVERIVAVVNDELITNLEVQTAMEPIVEQYTKLYEGMELKSKLKEARKKVVEKLVSDRLLLQEAI